MFQSKSHYSHASSSPPDKSSKFFSKTTSTSMGANRTTSTSTSTMSMNHHNSLKDNDYKQKFNSKPTHPLTKHTKSITNKRTSKMIRTFKVKDTHDAEAIAQVVTHIISPRNLMTTNTSTNSTANNNMTMTDNPVPSTPQLHQECLLSLRVAKFEFSGTVTNTSSSSTEKDGILYGTTTPSSTFSKFNPKAKHKVRYACITRGTTQPLLKRNKRLSTTTRSTGKVLVSYNNNEDYEEFIDVDDTMEHVHPSATSTTGESEEDGSEDDDDDDDDDEANDDYSLLYNPDTIKETHHIIDNDNEEDVHARDHRMSVKMKQRASSVAAAQFGGFRKDTLGGDNNYQWEQEVSSFPQLVCLAVYADGSNPHVKRIFDLDKLVAIDSVANEGLVRLVFQNGSIVEIDCDVEDDETDLLVKKEHGSNGEPLQKSRFLWSLLQIHAILCASVVERNVARFGSDVSGGASAGGILARKLNTNLLPPLTMRNIDRSELQYVSTMNGFLADNPVLLALLERQRSITARDKRSSQSDISKDKARGLSSREEKSNGADEMNGIAYDMIMGNFTNMSLFFNDEEKKDAEDVLNSIFRSSEHVPDEHNESEGKLDFDDIDTSDALTNLLRNKMRMLEAETCRRLIAWEDEKVYAASGISPDRRDTVESLSLANLFSTLDSLEKELENMEEWLLDKAVAIKPLTDDCREVEEENRQIEQQKYSFELLSIELERLLDCLEIDKNVESILKNPKSCLVYHSHGGINLVQSEPGVEDIYRAGKVLKQVFDKVYDDKGVHLRSVSERVEGLLQISDTFCENVANIIIHVMQVTAKNAVENDVGIEVKNISHTSVAKALRNTQKEFQSSLLGYIKLIEVLALLKPSILDSIRDKYSELVAEGIFSKKRMKTYFTSLPDKSVNMEMYTLDLSMYPPVQLKSSPHTDTNHPLMKPVQAQDIEMALSELLPVIAREAYFTAALFGLSAKHLSGREKKRNFESAKRSVDFSSRHFKYYITRICGIASEVDAEGKKVTADPMLSLISSILLNEAMDNYIDRQRRGGDHSLSLAYVRATILELRKKVDKQWVRWIEEQIQWIQTNAGVPLNGKRAGIFPSFSRFPSYLDHVMICCRARKSVDHVVNLSGIKVVAYYLQKLSAALFNSLHTCSERETTDQQYAANVMRMENSYFFTQTIKQRSPELVALFQKQITAASSICKQSTDSYLGFMIKREFKSLHSLFSNISRIRREVGDAEVPIHVPFSTFERTLVRECNRDVLKEKIGSIYFRMEKHLDEAGGLLPVAWKALVKVLYEWFGRWEKICTQIYNFNLSPNASDVVRIAKQVAGMSAAKKSKEEKEKATSPSSIQY